MGYSEQIKSFREKRSMSKSEFARFMDMSLVNVYRWEKGNKIGRLWIRELKRKGVITDGIIKS